jgi:hypothetical protein
MRSKKYYSCLRKSLKIFIRVDLTLSFSEEYPYILRSYFNNVLNRSNFQKKDHTYLF